MSHMALCNLEARRKRRLAATVAGIVAAFQAGSCMAAPSQPLGMFLEPPKLNYANTCMSPTPPQALSADWQNWNGTDNLAPSDVMLADISRLIEGDNDVVRDRVLARRMLEYLAAGNTTSAPEAKARLALLLLDPGSGTVDLARATKLLGEATAAQNTGAAVSMGKLIREGRLPGQSIEAATRYLSIAAGLGDPAAALQLAAIYAEPATALPFPDAAAHFATVAAINIRTALAAGRCTIALDVGDYLIDADPQQGRSHAIAWFQIAADGRDSRALARLARIHEDGVDGVKDPGKARTLWDKAAAQGLVRAFANAARLHLDAGDETPETLRLMQASVANGEADGYLLAARYYRGDYTGKADFAAMQRIIEEAMKRPDPSLYLIEMQAHAYLAGQGVDVDKARADTLYKRVLASGSAEAEALYGRYMLAARQGLDEGMQHLRKAAAGGSLTARYELAEVSACMADDDAEQALAGLAQEGHAPAMRRLARLLLDRGDREAGTKRMHDASNLGDRLASVELAALMTAGEKVAGIDIETLMQRASAAGSDVIEGRLALATAYRDGRLDGDIAKGIPLIESLAESGNPDVDFTLAAWPGPTSFTRERAAVQARLLTAASAGNADAMYMLSHLAAETGTGPSGSADWLFRAAEIGNVNALKELPVGDPTVLDRVIRALELQVVCTVPTYAEMARIHRLLGNADAAGKTMIRAEKLADRRPRDLHYLAEITASQAPGALNDPAKAARLYERAAKAGYGKSALALAALYAGGRLGDKGEDAVEWYRRAALAGEAVAMRELVRYASEQPDQRVSLSAMQALQTVAGNGDTAAMQAYGLLLATLGPERHEEGMTFLRKAAEKGDVQAMKTLARLFAAGVTGTVSAEESTHWTKLAAEKGDAEAMFQYAIALDLGFGVAIDRDLAQTWQQKAKQNGFLR